MRRVVPLCLAIAALSGGLLRLSTEEFRWTVSDYLKDATDLWNAPSEFYEVETPLVYEAALSTAVMVPREDVLNRGDGRAELAPLSSGQPTYCRLSKYWRRQRRSTGKCTGFLIEGDLLATAGHCLEQNPRRTCASYSWVFGYAVKNSRDDEAHLVRSSDVYRCREVVYAIDEWPDLYGRDFALIRLDRPVVGRAPLKMRRNGDVPDGSRLVAIGHPEGLPVKITRPGTVGAENRGAFTFSADLDIFHGNSGGPVIDADTGLVEGIVSGIGTEDHSRTYLDWRRGCLDIPTQRKTTIINRATNLPVHRSL